VKLPLLFFLSPKFIVLFLKIFKLYALSFGRAGVATMDQSLSRLLGGVT
jgi:hypothetical protein